MDRGAWWVAVHGVAKSRTRLSDFTFIFHFYVLEKEMATHSSVLAWRIPGTGEPGRLYGVIQSLTRLKRLSSSSRLYLTKLLCPWDSPGKDARVGCHFLLQRIFQLRDQTHITYISCIARRVVYH